MVLLCFPAGVTNDHLLLGTATGDCIVCDIANKGTPVFRFPAFKHQPLQHLLLDLDRGMMATSSKWVVHGFVRMWGSFWLSGLPGNCSVVSVACFGTGLGLTGTHCCHVFMACSPRAALCARYGDYRSQPD